MQFGVNGLANLPGAVVGNIHLSKLGIAFLLIALLFLVVYVSTKVYKWKLSMLIALAIFLSVRLYCNFERINQNGQLEFQLKNNSVQLQYKGKSGLLICENSLNQSDFQYQINPSLSVLGITHLDTIMSSEYIKLK